MKRLDPSKGGGGPLSKCPVAAVWHSHLLFPWHFQGKRGHTGRRLFKLSNKRDLVRFIPCGIFTAQNSVYLVKDTQISVGGG